ncbi:MAG TPA: hypothetical protein VLI90_02735 [Tepidisphaeraceae bacterium]|nr:hypothetical protein [Tepidisphaeraceae bacterium]
MTGDLDRPNIDQVDSPELDLVVEAYKSGVDKTLILENLRLTPQQRVEKLIALHQFDDELRNAIAGRSRGG